MAAPTVLHISDLHLGAQRYGITNPSTGEDTADESVLRTIDHLVNTALERQVSLVAITGDAFNTGNPPAEQVARLMDYIRTLTNNGIQVAVEDGNHGRHHVKATHRGPADLMAAVGATVYNTAGIYSIDTKDGVIHLIGSPWPERATLMEAAGATNTDPTLLDDIISGYVIDNLEDTLDDANLPSDEPRIFASHCTVSGVEVSTGSEGTINPRGLFEDVLISLPGIMGLEADYNALGHLHPTRNLTPAPATPAQPTASPSERQTSPKAAHLSPSTVAQTHTSSSSPPPPATL